MQSSTIGSRDCCWVRKDLKIFHWGIKWDLSLNYNVSSNCSLKSGLLHFCRTLIFIIILLVQRKSDLQPWVLDLSLLIEMNKGVTFVWLKCSIKASLTRFTIESAVSQLWVITEGVQIVLGASLFEWRDILEHTANKAHRIIFLNVCVIDSRVCDLWLLNCHVVHLTVNWLSTFIAQNWQTHFLQLINSFSLQYIMK